MCMARYFEASDEQKKRMQEFLELEREKIQEDMMKKSAREIKNNEDYLYII